MKRWGTVKGAEGWNEGRGGARNCYLQWNATIAIGVDARRVSVFCKRAILQLGRSWKIVFLCKPKRQIWNQHGGCLQIVAGRRLHINARTGSFFSLFLRLSLLSLFLSSSVSFVVAFICKDEKDPVNEGPCSLLRVSGGNSEKWPSPFWVRYLTQWLNRWFGSWKFGRSYGAMISLLGIRESIEICSSQRVRTVYK